VPGVCWWPESRRNRSRGPAVPGTWSWRSNATTSGRSMFTGGTEIAANAVGEGPRPTRPRGQDWLSDAGLATPVAVIPGQRRRTRHKRRASERWRRCPAGSPEPAAWAATWSSGALTSARSWNKTAPCWRKALRSAERSPFGGSPPQTSAAGRSGCVCRTGPRNPPELSSRRSPRSFSGHTPAIYRDASVPTGTNGLDFTRILVSGSGYCGTVTY
jgi:hypothetical protein